MLAIIELKRSAEVDDDVNKLEVVGLPIFVVFRIFGTVFC